MGRLPVALSAVAISMTLLGCSTADVSSSESPSETESVAPATAPITEPIESESVADEPPAPVLTMGQQQAVEKGEEYLDFAAFSRHGLIEQLAYEGFTVEDATAAVDFIAPDWNAQAAQKARDYLDMTSFSRQGLIDQLLYEGFSPAEAEHGAGAVGY